LYNNPPAFVRISFPNLTLKLMPLTPKPTLKFAALLLALLAASCVPLEPVATPTPTEQPSITPSIAWFPATNTPTAFIIPTRTATLEPLEGVEGVMFMDDFSDPALWSTSSSEAASAQVEANRLTLSLTSGRLSISSLRSQPVLANFYAEVTATTSLCRGSDEYGVLFRAQPGGSHYRFVLACDGQVRLERMIGGAGAILQNWADSSDAPPGAPGVVRIGVWAAGGELRLFLNGHLQFSQRDPVLPTGTLGFFATADGDTPVIISFSSLEVRSVVFVPTPYIAPTP
jgi:hypothetical protein